LSIEIVTRGESSRISSVLARIYEEEMVAPILTNKFEEILEIEEISPRSRFSIDKFGLNRHILQKKNRLPYIKPKALELMN
jgi:hypothetical protein